MSEVPGLTLEIRDNSEKAVAGLNALAASLDKLKAATAGLRLSSVAKQLGSLVSALSASNVPEDNISRIERLATALKTLKDVGPVKIKLGNGVTKMLGLEGSMSEAVRNSTQGVGEEFQKMSTTAEAALNRMSDEIDDALSKSRIDLLQDKLEGLKVALARGLESGTFDDSKIAAYAMRIQDLQQKIDELQGKAGAAKGIGQFTEGIERSSEEMAESASNAFQQVEDSIADVVNKSEIELLQMKLDSLKLSLSEGLSLGKLDPTQIANYALQIQNLQQKIDALRQAEEEELRESQTREEQASTTPATLQDTADSAEHAAYSLRDLSAALRDVFSGGGSLVSVFRGIGSSLGQVASSAGVAAYKGIRGIVSAPFKTAAAGVKGIAAAFNMLKDRVNLGNTALGKLLSSIKRVAMYRLIRSAIKMVTEGVKEGIENLYKWSDAMNGSFAASMDAGSAASLQFKNSIAAMLGPAIEAVIPLLITLANVAIQAANAINMFISALFGRATWTRAKEVSAGATKSLKGAGKAAKDADDKIKGLLADWDELNIIQNESSKDPNGGSGGGGGGGISAEDMFEQVDLAANWWTDLGSKIRDAIMKGDWEGAGAVLAVKLNEVVDRIKPEEWAGKLREVISNGIDFAIGFLDEFDFRGFGSKLGRFLTEMFSVNSEGMWDRIGTYLKLRFMGMIQFAAGAIEDPDLFIGIGSSLATMLTSAFDLSQDDINAIAEVFGGAISGVANAATTFFSETDFEEIGSKVNGILVAMFGEGGSIDGNAIGAAIHGAITSAASFVTAALGGEDSNIFESMAETVSAAVNKVFSFTGKEIDDLAYSVSMTINRAVKGVSTFLRETNFKSIGETVKNFLTKALGKDGYLDAGAIGTALKEAILAGFDTIDGLFGEEGEEGVFTKLAGSAAEFITSLFDLTDEEKAKIPSIINKAVKDAIEGVDRFFKDVNWGKIGEDIRYWIENINWSEITEALQTAIQDAFSAVETLGGNILLGLYNTIAKAWNYLIGDLVKLFPSLAAPLFGDTGAFEGWMETGNVEGLMQKLDGKYYMVNGTQARNQEEMAQYTDATEAVTEAVKEETAALGDLSTAMHEVDYSDIIEEAVGSSDIDSLYAEIRDKINVHEPYGSSYNAGDDQFWANVLEPLVRNVASASGITDEATGEIAAMFKKKWAESMYDQDFEGDIDGLMRILQEAIEEGIPDELKTPDTSGYEGAIANASNTTVNAASSAINALNQWASAAASLGGISVTTRSGWGQGVDPYHFVRKAEGGLVTTGQMFIAREAGPEYVGTMGNHTAVANNEQIVAGISSGVASANAEQNALLREQNNLLTQLLNKEFTAKAVPSSAWGRFQQQSSDMYARQTGRG